MNKGKIAGATDTQHPKGNTSNKVLQASAIEVTSTEGPNGQRANKLNKESSNSPFYPVKNCDGGDARNQ